MAAAHAEARTQASRPQKSGGHGRDARATFCAGVLPGRRPHKLPRAPNGRRRSRRIDAAHRQSHRQRSAVRFIAPLNRRAGTDAARNGGHPIPPRGVQGTASRSPRRPRQLYPPADGQPRPQPAATPQLPPAPLRLRKPDRRQVLLRPCSLEELLAPDHPARMGWAITERFDLEKFLTPIRAREGHAGRDATDPQVLVALWLYAAIDGVGSGRDGECRDQGLPRLGAAVGRIGRIFDRCVLAGMTRRNRTHLREGSVRRCCTYGYGYCQGQGPATVCAFACALNGGSAQTRPSVAALGRCRQ
jgi:transposase